MKPVHQDSLGTAAELINSFYQYLICLLAPVSLRSCDDTY